MKRVIQIVNKNQAEDLMIAYFATVNWEVCVKNVEKMRRRIWTAKLGYYPSKIEAIGQIRNIKDQDYVG